MLIAMRSFLTFGILLMSAFSRRIRLMCRCKVRGVTTLNAAIRFATDLHSSMMRHTMKKEYKYG